MDLFNFVESKKRELIQIYVNERTAKDNVYGILFIGSDGVEAKVMYLCLDDCPSPLKEDIQKRYKEKPNDSIIYFYICDMNTAHIVEIDIRESWD